MSGGSTRALFFSDLEGSTALLRQLGAEYPAVLGRHRAIVRAAIESAGGSEHQSEGDSFFVTFSSVSDSVSAAVEVQLQHQGEEWPEGRRVRPRVGLHVGHVSDTAAGLVGLAIHHAARIMACGHGGQIVVSEQVRALSETLPAELSFRSLGSYELRDVGSVRLFQVAHPGLDDVFPPLSVKGAAQTNLKAERTRFVGRDVERRELGELLNNHRLVTVTGAGGAGKSRLAREVCSALGGRFVDGIWFVDLHSVEQGSSVLAAVRSAAGVAKDASLEDVFKGQSVLFILDNCEHVIIDVADAIEVLLRISVDVSVVATSREPSHVSGEAVYRLPMLSVPQSPFDRRGVLASDAGALFVDRAQLVQHNFTVAEADARSIGEICRALDGLPLAIELAAARVANFPLAEISRLLDDCLRFLSGGPRSSPDHQRTLRATIEWSVALLTPLEQNVLAQLCVFSGSFDMAGVEGVIGRPDLAYYDLVDAIASLHHKSLLTSDDRMAGRFTLPKTTRQYVEQGLDEEELALLRDRHARWFAERVIELGEANEPGSVTRLLRVCEEESANLLAASEHLAHAEPELALRTLNWIARAADFGSADPVHLPTFRKVATAHTEVSPDELGFALATLSVDALLGLIDDDDMDLWEAATAIMAEIRNPGTRAELKALALYRRSIADSAVLTATEAADVTQLLDASVPVISHFWCRDLLVRITDGELARQLLNEAIQIAVEHGEPELAQYFRLYASIVMGWQGLTQPALETARTGLAGLRTLISQGRIDAEVVALVALLEGEHGDLATGIDLAEDLSISLLARTNNRRQLGAVTAVAARLRLLNGDLDLAEEHARQAINLLSADRVIVLITSIARITLATVLRLRGDPAASARQLSALAESPHATRSAPLLEEGAKTAWALGAHPTAADLLATAAFMRTEQGRPLVRADRPELEQLLTLLGGRQGRVLDVDAAVHAIRSLEQRNDLP